MTTLNPPFKGTDKTTVHLDADGIALCAERLAEVTLSGEVADVANDLDEFFDSAPVPGDHELSHDQIALLFTIMKAGLYAKSARKAARVLLDEFERAQRSFYRSD